MTNESHDQDREQGEAPAAEDLQEPSTEKEPDAEPKAQRADDPEPDHEAVGIGVIGGPLIDPEQSAQGDDPSTEDAQGTPKPGGLGQRRYDPQRPGRRRRRPHGRTVDVRAGRGRESLIAARAPAAQSGSPSRSG